MVLLIPLALAEIGELSPWLADRCIRVGTRMLSNTRARERFAEEWRAGLNDVPGKLTKLCFAIGIVTIVVPAMRMRDLQAEREVPGMRLACDRALSALDDADSPTTLAELIAHASAAAVGFRDVVVGLAQLDGSIEIVATSGPAEIRELLMGKRVPRDIFDAALHRAENWGTLSFATTFEDFTDNGFGASLRA